MREVTGDLFTFKCFCVPINLQTKANGALVMGAGVAKAALDLVPKIAGHWGIYYSKYWELPAEQKPDFDFCKVDWCHDPETGDEKILIGFPTKYHWKDKSDLTLIRLSTLDLLEVVDSDLPDQEEIALPAVGAGLGGLSWDRVKSILDIYLDDRFVVVYKDKT